ncbi:MAG TPA: hypothetical protein VEG66_07430 [Thermoplasmata archaeon]|nr:hypothetical protein [Thermoplasmata archaeon]
MARIHKASGVRERDLIARAKVLRGTVEPLLPRLGPDCPSDRFDRRREELEEVRSARDDDRRLGRLSRWGDPLARAYAGLLKYYLDPKNPSVVTFSLPAGEVSFAPFARTDREAEVAVQQSDHPDRLMLGYLDWARKGLHFFATSRFLFCSGLTADPPPEFRAERVADLPYRLTENSTEHRFECVHLQSGEPRPFLEVGWPGATTRFRVCRRCVKDDRHLLANLSDGAAGPDPSSDFPVSAELNIRCRGGADCPHANLPSLSKGLRRDYELGRLADAGLLDAYVAEATHRVERSGRTTFIAGGVCYGSAVAPFLDSLAPTPVERRALEAVLGTWAGSFEVDEARASRALEKLWNEHAETIVRTIVPDPQEARQLIEETRSSPGRIAELLKRAERSSEEKELLGTLPRYSRLAAEAAWVDRVARAFRTHHEAGAERTIVQTLPNVGKERGLAFAFLLALGRDAAHAWQYSPTEREFGASLKQHAHELLTAPASHYHQALDRLLQAAGVADWGQSEGGTA